MRRGSRAAETGRLEGEPAVPRKEPRSVGRGRGGRRMARPCPDRRGGWIQAPRRMGKRIPAYHEQRAPDRHPGRSGRNQASYASRHLAGEAVNGPELEPKPDSELESEAGFVFQVEAERYPTVRQQLTF